MWIDVSNVMCRVTLAEDDELEWLRGYLTFSCTKFPGSKGRAVSMLAKNGSFPGGLLSLVQDAAKRDSVDVELRDRRVSRIKHDPTADLAWLYPFQRDALQACLENKRGIVRAPTGSGKGDMICGVVKMLPGRWLFTVHRDNLVDQQMRRFARLGGGLPGRELSRTPPSSWDLVVGLNLITLQSLASAIRNDPDSVRRAFDQLDGVIVDECHVAPADVYFDAIQRCPAEYRLGFSGTPLDRTDNRSLMAIAALGRVIYQIKARPLIDAGVIAEPAITMVQCKQQPPPSKMGGPRLAARAKAAAELYNNLVVDSDVRNDLIVDMVREADKPSVVFVKIIRHGRELMARFARAGIPAEFVWGDKTTESRHAAIERLERGDSQVMVASVVLQEGTDIPCLRSVIVGGGGKAVIATLQRIGRGMRTDGGRKSTFQVFDVLDVGAPMLERHSRRRMKTYVRESYPTVVRAADGSTREYKPKLLTRREKREAGEL